MRSHLIPERLHLTLFSNLLVGLPCDVSFLLVSPPKLCMHFPSYLHILHPKPLSTSSVHVLIICGQQQSHKASHYANIHTTLFIHPHTALYWQTKEIWFLLILSQSAGTDMWDACSYGGYGHYEMTFDCPISYQFRNMKQRHFRMTISKTARSKGKCITDMKSAAVCCWHTFKIIFFLFKRILRKSGAKTHADLLEKWLSKLWDLNKHFNAVRSF